jgi:hypothetical protein
MMGENQMPGLFTVFEMVDGHSTDIRVLVQSESYSLLRVFA